MKQTFRHIYQVPENTGEPSAYSDIQRGMDVAQVKFHEAGGWKWSKMTIEALASDAFAFEIEYDDGKELQ